MQPVSLIFGERGGRVGDVPFHNNSSMEPGGCLIMYGQLKNMKIALNATCPQLGWAHVTTLVIRTILKLL